MANASIATAYLDALEDGNLEAATVLLTDDATITIPLSNTGDLDPWLVFEGKDAALGYITTIFQNFSQVMLTERNIYAADDGRTIFVETVGALIQRDTGASYRNRYVFKFTVRDSQVSRLDEYANPVAFAKLMGMALG